MAKVITLSELEKRIATALEKCGDDKMFTGQRRLHRNSDWVHAEIMTFMRSGASDAEVATALARYYPTEFLWRGRCDRIVRGYCPGEGYVKVTAE